MKKISKSKKGFTLIEMILVIAIIAILAAVVFKNVSVYLEKANSASAQMVDYSVEVASVLGTIS